MLSKPGQPQGWQRAQGLGLRARSYSFVQRYNIAKEQRNISQKSGRSVFVN